MNIYWWWCINSCRVGEAPRRADLHAGVGGADDDHRGGGAPAPHARLLEGLLLLYTTIATIATITTITTITSITTVTVTVTVNITFATGRTSTR